MSEQEFSPGDRVTITDPATWGSDWGWYRRLLGMTGEVQRVYTVHDGAQVVVHFPLPSGGRGGSRPWTSVHLRPDRLRLAVLAQDTVNAKDP